MDEDPDLHEEPLRERILHQIEADYAQKELLVGSEVLRNFEKGVLLQTLDSHWKEHLAAMDYLRQGIYLRGYAQKNPKQEYKREAFEMFSRMLEEMKHDVVGVLSKVVVRTTEAEVAAMEAQRREQSSDFEFKHEAFAGFREEEGEETKAEQGGEEEGSAEAHRPYVRSGRKIGRNEPCPCGSGKKYKQCHGRLE